MALHPFAHTKQASPAAASWEAWVSGNNYAGQLAQGNTTTASSPVRAGSAVTWKAVSLFNYGYTNPPYQFHGVKSDGTLWACGGNDYYNLGTGDAVSRSTPVQVGSGTSWSNVCSGAGRSWFLKSDGTIWACGYNVGYDLGLGFAQAQVSTPVQLGSATNWVSVSSHSAGAFGINSSGELYAWGADGFSTYLDGTGSNTAKSTPVRVGSAKSWSRVAGCRMHSLFLATDGTLWVSGTNSFGCLGIPTSGVSTPVRIGSATTWSKMSVGDNHSAGIRTDGTLWVWGNGANGRLGNGSTGNVSAPTQLGSATDWADVRLGFDYTLLIKTDGTLFACGRNHQGQLGLGDTTDRSVPSQVGSLTTWAKFDSVHGSGNFAALKT